MEMLNILSPRLLLASATIVMGLLTWQAVSAPPVFSDPDGNTPALEDAGIRLRQATHESALEEDLERFEEIRTILRSIPTGRETLRLLEQYQVKVQFQDGTGTWYNWSNNTIIIDSNKGSTQAVFSVVHEMTHASRHHRGRHAHLLSLPRQEYIEQLLEEEAEGDVRAIEVKLELEAVGYPAFGRAATLEDLYMAGYKSAVGAATAGSNPVGEAELNALGRQAGKQAIIAGYLNGRAVASINLKTYPEIYGAYWAQVIQASRGPAS